jgi:hypothetical protein
LRDCSSWPAAYALMVSAAVLLQHEVFEKFLEIILAFAVLYALLGLSLRAKFRSDTALA